MKNPQHHSPRKIRIIRAQGKVQIDWQNGQVSSLPLDWLRAHCPCATCRSERGESGVARDPLALTSGPLPSCEVADVELVGGYAIRITWQDGHDTGIYAFSWLYEARPETGPQADGG